MVKIKIALVLPMLFLLGCAQTSPKDQQRLDVAADSLTASAIFDKTFKRHGGSHIASLADVNVAVDGEWHYLITKIQPEVTDAGYRQQSEERLLLSPRTYAALYRGDEGTKRVYRTAQSIDVAYNDELVSDTTTKEATALTADAFYLFVLGPLALVHWDIDWYRLEDKRIEGRDYYRINGKLDPGIGLSDSDFLTLWVDKETHLTYRFHITLEGFESTRGAHVDTTYLDYTDVGPYTFPIHFFERVRGPIAIDAHEWWYTGIDINRGLMPGDLAIDAWSEDAAAPAKALQSAK